MKHPYSNRHGETAEMMRQYYRAKWSLEAIENKSSNKQIDSRDNSNNKKRNSVPDFDNEVTVQVDSNLIIPPNVHSAANNRHNSQNHDSNERGTDVIETNFKLNELPHKVRFSAILTDEIQTQIQEMKC